MPPEWVQLSKNPYEADISRSRHIPYDASGGLGYNTSMRLQNALLLDQTEDYRRFAEDLLCLCYAPGLPEPYLVPECASYSDRLQAPERALIFPAAALPARRRGRTAQARGERFRRFLAARLFFGSRLPGRKPVRIW